MTKNPTNKLRLWGVIALLLGLATGIGGTLAGFIISRWAVASTSAAAPETKAQSLSDGITVMMNAPIVGAVFGVLGLALIIASFARDRASS